MTMAARVEVAAATSASASVRRSATTWRLACRRSRFCRPRFGTARTRRKEATDRAYGMAAIDCPEQLVTNQGLRGYLEGFGINPDA